MIMPTELSIRAGREASTPKQEEWGSFGFVAGFTIAGLALAFTFFVALNAGPVPDFSDTVPPNAQWMMGP
jgi:hypothetical protein